MKSDLDVLIEELQAATSRATKAQDAAQQVEAPQPRPMLDGEGRFAQPHAKLFPFIGRKVRTPAGTGTLVQVFAERVTVLLDAEVCRCSFFSPAHIEPVRWEL